MITSKDNIPEFIPDRGTKLVILGSMASIEARDVGKKSRHQDAFYYHHKTNHFWRILQMVFEPHKEPKNFKTSDEKKVFLNKWQIAMANIISEINIQDSNSKDPSDQVIFEAYKKGEVKFKKVRPAFKQLIKDRPIFFTCSKNKYIISLLEAYFKDNKIKLDLEESIKFLMTSTRCNPLERSLGWKIRMAEHGVSTKTITIP